MEKKKLEYNKEAWTNKGITLAKQGNWEEAIKCFDKALEFDPTYKEAWNNKGVALFNQGKLENA